MPSFHSEPKMWKKVAPGGNEDLGAEVQCFASQKRKREKGQGKHQCKQLFKSPLEMAVFLGLTEPQLHLLPVHFLASCLYTQVVLRPLVSTGLVSTYACCSTYQAHL